MSALLPDLWKSTIEQRSTELLKFQDLTDFLQLFPQETIADELIEDVIFTFLNDIGQASLSDNLFDPTVLRHDVATFKHHRYSTAAKAKFTYEDWKRVGKMGILDSNVAQIVAKPNIQATHYFFQGKELLDDYTQGNPPRTTQYNFATDVGANALASTLLRPIGCNQVTGAPNTWEATAGAWTTYANMANDLNNLISGLGTHGFENYSDILVFYPRAATKAMKKKRVTTGQSNMNAFMELEDLGISESQIISCDNLYLYTRAGALPANGAFDLMAVSKSNVKVYNTLPSFVNLFTDNSGTRFPGVTLECGRTFLPMFKPVYDPSDQKHRKGVTMITAINGA